MSNRAIASQQAEFALTETARIYGTRHVRDVLRLFKERCLLLLIRVGEFISAGGPLS